MSISYELESFISLVASTSYSTFIAMGICGERGLIVSWLIKEDSGMGNGESEVSEGRSEGGVSIIQESRLFQIIPTNESDRSRSTCISEDKLQASFVNVFGRQTWQIDRGQRML